MRNVVACEGRGSVWRSDLDVIMTYSLTKANVGDIGPIRKLGSWPN